MSDSCFPRLQPTRLLCPYSPGKNTGVSCRFSKGQHRDANRSHRHALGRWGGAVTCAEASSLSAKKQQGILQSVSTLFKGMVQINYPVLVAQSCPAVWDTMDCSPPGSPVHGILQARILEWVAMPSSRGSSRPRDRTCISCIIP